MRPYTLALLQGALPTDNNPLLCSVGPQDPEWRRTDEIAAYNTLNSGGPKTVQPGGSGGINPQAEVSDGSRRGMAGRDTQSDSQFPTGKIHYPNCA